MRFSRTPLTDVLHRRRPACPGQSRKGPGAVTMAAARPRRCRISGSEHATWQGV